MKQEDLKKLLIEFAEFLEQYGAENITNGIELYADEFARRQVKLFCQPAVIKSVCQCTEEFDLNEVGRNPLVYKCTKCGQTVL